MPPARMCRVQIIVLYLVSKLFSLKSESVRINDVKMHVRADLMPHLLCARAARQQAC